VKAGIFWATALAVVASLKLPQRFSQRFHFTDDGKAYKQLKSYQRRYGKK